MAKNGWIHPAQLAQWGVVATTHLSKRALGAVHGLVAVLSQLYNAVRDVGVLPWQWWRTSVLFPSGSRVAETSVQFLVGGR
jgi:hypothetical protein